MYDESFNHIIDIIKEETIYIVNRLKKFGILSSVDGPENNVIKIKPPLTFNKHNCNMFILYLHKILSEDFLNKRHYE